MLKTPDFSKIDKASFDLSCMAIKPVLVYIEKRFGKEELKKFVIETGMDLDYLEDKDNWISFDYYNAFLEKLVIFTGNPDVAYETGRYFSYSFFNYMLNILKLVSTPLIAFKKAAEYSSLYTRIGKFEYTSTGNSKGILKYVIFPGHTQSKLNCDAIKGLYAAFPSMWGLPPAKIKEIQCQAEGADSCVYEISYMKNPIFKNIITLTIALIMVVLETVGFYIFHFKFAVREDILITILLAALIVLIMNKPPAGKENESIETENERTKALEKAIVDSREDLHELQIANKFIREEAEKLSVLKEVAERINYYKGERDTLEKVIEIIIEKMGFLRGYYLVFNKQFEIQNEPSVFYMDKPPKRILNNKYTAQIWKDKLQGYSSVNYYSAVNLDLFDSGREDNNNHESIILPILIHDKYSYYIIFDIPSARTNMRESYRQFFITISNQIEVALNKIYAVDAARNIISNIPSSIAVFDTVTLRISFFNESFIKEMKLEPSRITGCNILDVIGIENSATRDYFINQIKMLRNRNIFDDQELSIGKETLGYTLFELSGNGDMREAGIIMKNITAQKEMKEQLYRAEKMAALGTLVSGVAHEINNPLYGILGNAEIIRDEAESKNIRENAETIIEFTIHASDIVKDLSSYSRSIKEEKPANLNLNDIMDEALRIVRYSRNFIDITVKKDYSDIPPVFVYGGDLHQVFVNLYSNAIDAMNGKGVLTVSSSYSNNMIITSVSDTGIGISQENITKIFNPFFTTKEAGKGTGLGLSIVYSLVTKNKGMISVRSGEKEGTVFEIKFMVKEGI